MAEAADDHGASARQRREHDGERASIIDVMLDALERASSFEEALISVLCALREAGGWEYGAAFRHDARHDVMRFAGDAGVAGDELRAVMQAGVVRRGAGLGGRAWERSVVVRVDALAELTDCSRARAAHASGLEAGLCLAIAFDGQVRCVLELYGPRWAAEACDGRSLRDAARITAACLRQHERTGVLTRSAKAVTGLVSSMARARTPADMLQAMLAALREPFAWAYGSYWERDVGRGVMHCTLEAGNVDDEFRQQTSTTTFAPGAGPLGQAWATGDMVLLALEGARGARLEVARRAGLCSALFVPLSVQGEVVGVLELLSERPPRALEEHEEALRSALHLCTTIVERIHERQRLAQAFDDYQCQLNEMAVELEFTVGYQSASAQELSASMQRLMTMVAELRQTSAAALEQAEAMIASAQQSAETATSGIDAVARAVASIRNIWVQVGVTAEHIMTLSSHTSRATVIVSSVSEIASQSRILAFNAAIEAARAGEHGRGFGVVAAEVRLLAEQSRAATSQITQILGAIGHNTSAASSAMEESMQRAESGVALAERSGKSISDLEEALVASSRSAQMIADGARDQNIGIAGIDDALVGISRATDGVAGALKHMESAAAQLSALHTRMRELLTSSGFAEEQESVGRRSSEA